MANKYKASNKPSRTRVVPVGNVAPYTTNVGLGGRASSADNMPRSTPKKKKAAKKKVVTKKSPIRNSAPRARVPNIGNTSSGGMWGF